MRSTARSANNASSIFHPAADLPRVRRGACFGLGLVDCPLLFCAGLPDIVRPRSGQRCSPARNGRFARPSTHSAYTYTPSGSSPARLVSFSRVPPRCGPDRGRAWHLWSSSARCSVARPHSRSMRRRSRRLRGDTRRNASSVNTPPRLATCLTAHPTNRVAACRSVRRSPPRPLPHLP